MYRYTIENESKACTEISLGDVEQCVSLGEFQGAEDLPDGVEFARGFDPQEKPITVYREQI